LYTGYNRSYRVNGALAVQPNRVPTDLEVPHSEKPLFPQIDIIGAVMIVWIVRQRIRKKEKETTEVKHNGLSITVGGHNQV